MKHLLPEGEDVFPLGDSPKQWTLLGISDKLCNPVHHPGLRPLCPKTMGNVLIAAWWAVSEQNQWVLACPAMRLLFSFVRGRALAKRIGFRVHLNSVFPFHSSSGSSARGYLGEVFFSLLCGRLLSCIHGCIHWNYMHLISCVFFFFLLQIYIEFLTVGIGRILRYF